MGRALSVRACLGQCRFASVSLRFIAQAELHADLVMPDPAIDDMALDLRHLKPFKIPKGSCGRLNAMLDRILDARFRCSDDFGDAVDMITHVLSPFEVPVKIREKGWRGRLRPSVNIHAAMERRA